MNHILPILCENPSRIKRDYSSLPGLTAFPGCRTFIVNTGEVLGKRRWPVTLAELCITVNAFRNLTPVFPTPPPSAAHPTILPQRCSCPIPSLCAPVPNELTSHVTSVLSIRWATMSSSGSFYCHVSLLRGQDQGEAAEAPQGCADIALDLHDRGSVCLLILGTFGTLSALPWSQPLFSLSDWGLLESRPQVLSHLYIPTG